MRTLVAVVLGLILMVSATTSAQDNSDILIDLDRERSADRQIDVSGLTPLQRGSLTLFQQGVLGTGPACTAAEWSWCGEVDLLLPLTFNSNPRGTPQQTEDGHGRPSISLIGAVKHYSVSLVASVDTAFDRYIEDSEANSNVLRFWLGASVAPSEQWSLYLGYRPTLTYSEDFNDLKKTFHDVLGGARWIHEFGTPQKEKLPFKLVADLNGGPRAADPSTFSAVLATLSVALTYSRFDDQGHGIGAITFKPTIGANWYDQEVAGKDRRDVRVGANVTLKWNPWHANENSTLRGAFFAFQVSVARSDSNVAGRSFTVWDVGPSFFIALGNVPQGIKPTRVLPKAQP